MGDGSDGGGRPHDLAFENVGRDGSPPAPDLARAAADLAAAPDLAQAPPDFAQAPPDLAMSTAGTLEGPCNGATVCPGANCGGLNWSGCCMPGSNLCELVDFDGTCQTVSTMNFEWGPPNCM